MLADRERSSEPSTGLKPPNAKVARSDLSRSSAGLELVRLAPPSFRVGPAVKGESAGEARGDFLSGGSAALAPKDGGLVMGVRGA
jgi:hypothetical protein